MSETKPNHPQKRSSTLPFKPPFFYGWVIVFISALTLFFSGPGQTYSVSTFIDSYIIEFGWSRSLVSFMYSLGTLIAGLIMGVIGSLFDRRGHRFMTTIVVIVFGLVCLGMSFVNSIVMLFTGFLLIRLLGQGSMSLSSSTLAPQWFITKRGRVLSIVSLGGAFSSAMIPPLNIWLIQTYGWRFGWRFWAILLWVVMMPIGYYLIRDRPEVVGLRPDNRITLRNHNETTMNVDQEPSLTAQEALRTRSFWLIMYCSMVSGAIGTGLIFHNLSVMAQIGFPPMIAALVLSSAAVTRLPFVLIAGPIVDRMPSRYLLAISEGILFVAIVVILYATSMPMVLLYGALIGILMAFMAIVRGVIWPDYFGRHNLGSIRGLSFVGGVIGSALGPLPFGVAFDYFGGYSQILTLSLIFPILGIIAALLARPPQKVAPISIKRSPSRRNAG